MTDIPHFCPMCGYNYTADAPVEIDGWQVALHGVTFGGKFIRLTGCEAIVAHSIASAGGEIVRSSVLNERIGYDGDGNVVQVMIARIRKNAPGIPIETVWRTGYRWRCKLAEAA